MTPELRAWADEILKRPMPEPYTPARPAQKRGRAYPHQPPTTGRHQTKYQEKRERESWKPAPGYKIPYPTEPERGVAPWARAGEDYLSAHLDEIWPSIGQEALARTMSSVRRITDEMGGKEQAQEQAARNRGMRPMFGQKAG